MTLTLSLGHDYVRTCTLQLHRLLTAANGTCTGIRTTSTVKLTHPLPLLFCSVQKKQLGYREAICMHVYLVHGQGGVGVA